MGLFWFWFLFQHSIEKMVNQIYKKKVVKAAQFIRERATISPAIGFLTGTGLGASADSMDITESFDYSKIPYFPVSTVESHKGKLLCGSLAGVDMIAMQGRFHLYEGYSPMDVTFPVRVMQELGVKYLIISNASGGINLNYSPGDIMIIEDHINLTGQSPLAGPNEDTWGLRFPDMINVYDKKLSMLAEKAVQNRGLTLRKGVYAGLCGPSLETCAETRFLKIIGSDAVGFSTVMEAIAGVHGGMKILGLATITNINDPDDPQKATVEEIIQIAEKAAADVDAVLTEVVGKLKED
ncbi:MAG: purine-nucleoside phosphorylase [Thermodesulfobacteriota bacterium]|nr:purine-nucleoside phosphorylase [Thermodesulfobacteriota bacterium]